MKKVLALVLAVVMVCTMAFAATTPIWTGNGGSGLVDEYCPKYNTLQVTGTSVFFNAAKAPVMAADGKTVGTLGNVAYYTVTTQGKIKTDAKQKLDTCLQMVSDTTVYVITNGYNKYNTNVIKNSGSALSNGQTTPGASAFLTAGVANTQNYQITGTVFTAWADGCGNFAKPTYLSADDTYIAFTFGGVNYVAKAEKAVAQAADHIIKDLTAEPINVLVDGAVYTVAANTAKTATPHVWAAASWDAKGNALTYKCANCGLVGTVVASSFVAPEGQTLYNINGGTLITVTLPAADNGTTTNPDTGANDVIGVAAALAVVALVSGAAISLKK